MTVESVEADSVEGATGNSSATDYRERPCHAARAGDYLRLRVTVSSASIDGPGRALTLAVSGL